MNALCIMLASSFTSKLLSLSCSSISLIDANIIGLRSEITKLLSSVEELDHMRHLKEEYERVDKENVRYKLDLLYSLTIGIVYIIKDDQRHYFVWGRACFNALSFSP